MANDSPLEARLAAVVLNYRTPDLTEQCVQSLLPQLEPGRDVAVVVDNASGDGSLERLRALEAAHAGALRVLASERNGGFAAGNNLGVGAVRAELYLLINSDTQLLPGCIEALVAALEREPRVGLASPRLEWPDGTPQISCFRFPTPTSELLAAARTAPLDRLLARHLVALPVSPAPRHPDWTSFAAVMLRREALAQIGGLDEGYFLYYEDIDACWQLRRAGWELVHEPAARVVHLRGGSGPVKRLTAEQRRRPGYFYAARRRYFRKVHGPAGPLLANLGWSLGRLISWLRETLGSKQPHTVERELVDNWFAK